MQVEATEELGRILEELKKIRQGWHSLGIQNYETFSSAVWKREQFRDLKWLRRKRPDYPRRFHTSLAPIRIYIGGNSSGKTYTGVAEAVMHATGRYPKWYPHKGRLRQPTSGRILVSDYSNGAGEVIVPLLDKLIPKIDLQNVIKHPQLKIPVKYIFKNGSRIEIKSVKEEIADFRGWKGDWLFCDEPVPQDKWTESIRGVLTRGGRVWMTLTLTTEFWIYEELLTKPKYPESDVEGMEVSIYDNPYMQNEDIKRFERNLSYDERQLRVYGKPHTLMGLIFKVFRPDIHVVKPFDITGDNFSRYMAIDPHSRKPSVLGWFATNGEYYFMYNEMEIDSSSYRNIGQVIKTTEMEYRNEKGKLAEITMRIMDPRFAKQPGRIANTVELEFAKVGQEIGYPLFFQTQVDTDLNRGHMAIQQVLEYDIKKPVKYSPLNPIVLNGCVKKEMVAKNDEEVNEPRMYIFNNCHKAVKAMRLYSNKIDKDGVIGDRIRPLQKYKDFVDIIRYFLMSNPSHLQVEEKKRTFEQMIGRGGDARKWGLIRGY